VVLEKRNGGKETDTTMIYSEMSVFRMVARGRIFSCVRPLCERVVSDLDRSMHRSLWGLGHSQLVHRRVTHN